MWPEHDTKTGELSQQKYAERVYVPRHPPATSELSAAEAGEESDASGKEVVEVRVDAHATDELEGAGESKETAEVQMADMRLAVDLATLGSAEGKHGAVEFWTKEAANDTWYFVDTSQATHGPAEVSVLKSAFAAKTLADDCRVWNGTSQMSWTPLRKVSALYSQLQAATGPPTTAPNTTAHGMNNAIVELESKYEAELETVDLVRLRPVVAELLAKARELLPQSENVNEIVVEGGHSVAQVIVDACPVSNLPFDVADIILSFAPPPTTDPLKGCTFWLKASSGNSAPPSSLLRWLLWFHTATPKTTVINYVPIWQWLAFKLVCLLLFYAAVPYCSWKFLPPNIFLVVFFILCVGSFFLVFALFVIFYHLFFESPLIQTINCNPGFWLPAPSMVFRYSDFSVMIQQTFPFFCFCCFSPKYKRICMFHGTNWGVGTPLLRVFPDWKPNGTDPVVNLLVHEMSAAADLF